MLQIVINMLKRLSSNDEIYIMAIVYYGKVRNALIYIFCFALFFLILGITYLLLISILNAIDISSKAKDFIENLFFVAYIPMLYIPPIARRLKIAFGVIPYLFLSQFWKLVWDFLRGKEVHWEDLKNIEFR